MGIFRRGTKDTNPVLPEPSDPPDPTEPDDAADPHSDPHSSGPGDTLTAGDEKHGPFDRSEVAGLDGRLDLG